MSKPHTNTDEDAIWQLVRAQARHISWSGERPANWAGYKEGFLPFATLIASARPALPQTVDDFISRMKGLSLSSLHSFEEKALNGAVHVFGNVAVAIVAGQTLENGNELNRDVSGYLLVKESGRWRIAAQAWDKEKEGQKIPAAMLSSD